MAPRYTNFEEYLLILVYYCLVEPRVNIPHRLSASEWLASEMRADDLQAYTNKRRPTAIVGKWRGLAEDLGGQQSQNQKTKFYRDLLKHHGSWLNQNMLEAVEEFEKKVRDTIVEDAIPLRGDPRKAAWSSAVKYLDSRLGPPSASGQVPATSAPSDPVTFDPLQVQYTSHGGSMPSQGGYEQLPTGMSSSPQQDFTLFDPSWTQQDAYAHSYMPQAPAEQSTYPPQPSLAQDYYQHRALERSEMPQQIQSRSSQIQQGYLAPRDQTFASSFAERSASPPAGSSFGEYLYRSSRTPSAPGTIAPAPSITSVTQSLSEMSMQAGIVGPRERRSRSPDRSRPRPDPQRYRSRTDTSTSTRRSRSSRPAAVGPSQHYGPSSATSGPIPQEFPASPEDRDRAFVDSRVWEYRAKYQSWFPQER